MNKDQIVDSVTIQAEYLRETPKSIRLDCEGDSEWFPKSQVNFDQEKNELTLPKWLHREKFPNEPV